MLLDSRIHWRCSDDQNILGAPGWLSWLSARLQLRSWSRCLWVWAPHRALCWQHRAWSLLWILCLPLSLLLPHPCSVSLSLSPLKINLKTLKKNILDACPCGFIVLQRGQLFNKPSQVGVQGITGDNARVWQGRPTQEWLVWENEAKEKSLYMNKRPIKKIYILNLIFK